jgi:hypothetical protein
VEGDTSAHENLYGGRLASCGDNCQHHASMWCSTSHGWPTGDGESRRNVEPKSDPVRGGRRTGRAADP